MSRQSLERRLDRKTVLLLGTGRSGTTWLAGLLAGAFRYRLLFEPFQPDKVEGAELIADRYFDPGEIPEEAIDFCERALNDRIDNDWIACNSNRRLRMHRWRFWPRVRICKSIRSNLFLPAYRAIFGDRLPILVVMRHPGVVVESFLRVKFPWAFDLGTLLEPRQREQLEGRFGLPLAALARMADTEVGSLTLRWIVENGWMETHGRDLGIDLVLYEDLLEDPSRVVSLCRRLGIEVPPDLERRFHSFTWTTHPRSPIRKDRKSLGDWRARLDRKDVAKIEAMLDLAEVEYPP